MARAWLVVFLWVGTGCPSPLLEPTEGQPSESQNQNLIDAGADFSSGASNDGGSSPEKADAGRAPPAAPGDGGTTQEPGGANDAGPVVASDAGSELVQGRPDAGARDFPWTYVRSNVDPSWVASPPVCQEQDWLTKYFHYRNRLNGTGPGNPGFVQVGVGQGRSLPASHRNPEGSCTNGWLIETAGTCVPNDAPGAHGSYGWGDATVKLGYYLATLAAEYEAFRILGLDTSTTVSDLYHALLAFERLDEHAEELYELPGEKNGFFLRDDVPGDFWQAEDGSYRFPRADEFDGYGCMFSDYNCGEASVSGGDFISLDQAVGMVFGLAFVAHFVEETVVFENRSLNIMAKQMVHRVVNFLRSNDWKVVDPTGENPPAEWGGNAQGLSNQLAKAANRVVGDFMGIDDYRDTTSLTVGAAGFAGLDASWAVQLWYNRSMALELASVTNTWSSTHLAKRARDVKAPLYAYANAVLNGVPVGEAISDWQVASALTEAPCSGPCNGTAECEERPGWRGFDRWRNSGAANGDVHQRLGEYNGIDYLFMHNLFVIHHAGRHTVRQPAVVPAACGGFAGLATVLNQGPSATFSYDGYSECVAVDEWRHYCGRPWASWLEDAYAGRATIFTGEGKWVCESGQACSIELGHTEGTSGVDLYLGTGAADVFEGGSGNDCIYGFGEADHLEGNQGADEIHGGYGNDTIYGEGDGLNIDGDPDWLFGDVGNDHLHGGPSRDVLYGGEGNDTLKGNGGDDYLGGGQGADELRGGDGDDIIECGDGNDAAWGDPGDDLMLGQAGNDKLNGESGNDNLRGDIGNDFLRGGTGDDRLGGWHGNDRLCGNGGSDHLDGYGGDDACRGGTGNDDLYQCDQELAYGDCTESAFNDWTP